MNWGPPCTKSKVISVAYTCKDIYLRKPSSFHGFNFKGPHFPLKYRFIVSCEKKCLPLRAHLVMLF